MVPDLAGDGDAILDDRLKRSPQRAAGDHRAIELRSLVNGIAHELPAATPLEPID